MELLIFAGLVALTAGIGYAAWRLMSAESIERRKTLAAVDAQPISSLEDNDLAKIVGCLSPCSDKAPLEAPLSGQPALYYRVRIEQRVRSGNSRYWTSFADVQDCHDEVWLEDDSGDRILLDLETADIELSMDTHLRTGSLSRSNERVDSLLARCGASRDGKTLRYEEGSLAAEGERVVALGRCVVEPNPDPDAERPEGGYREVGVRKRLTTSSERALLVSDDPSLQR